MKILNLNISNHWNEEAVAGIALPIFLFILGLVFLSIPVSSILEDRQETERIKLYYQHCGTNCLPPKQALAGGA